MTTAAPEHPSPTTDPDARPSPLARVLMLFVGLYQRTALLRPTPRCRFHPTCSQYALDSLRVHGAVRGLGIAAVALFTAFALANRQYVSFGWLFGATEVQEVGGDRVGGGVPLIVLLAGAFALGAIVGGVWATLRSRSRARGRA